MGIFNKNLKYLPDTVKIHSKELVSLRLENNILKEKVDDLVDRNNRLVDCVKLLDKKLTLLSDCFQLEFDGTKYINKQKGKKK